MTQLYGPESESECGNRSIVPGTRVHLTGESTPVGQRRGDGACESQVTVVRDGGVIRAVDVMCSCGRKVRLKCVY